jgi:tRNA-specific 2-thiouridylase
MMEARPASVDVLGEGVMVIFDEPQWAPAPGQSAVIYDEDMVIGGGIIVEALQEAGKG